MDKKKVAWLAMNLRTEWSGYHAGYFFKLSLTFETLTLIPGMTNTYTNEEYPRKFVSSALAESVSQDTIDTLLHERVFDNVFKEIKRKNISIFRWDGTNRDYTKSTFKEKRRMFRKKWMTFAKKEYSDILDKLRNSKLC